MSTRCGRSRPRRALFELVAVLTLLGSILAACGSSDEPSSQQVNQTAPDEPQPGGKLAYGLSLDIDGLNPINNQFNSSNINVAKAIYDPIAVINEQGVAEPYLVESIEANEDFTEWTITARDGVQFHNGDPLTAVDIATHLKNVQLGPLTSFAFEPMIAVGVVDEVARPEFEAGEITQEEYDLKSRQVVVYMEEPWSAFPALLTTLQMAFVAHPDFESGEIDDPIGTGPFVLDEYIQSDRVVVTRNDSYWRAGLPYLNEIEFRILIDPENRRQALEAGDVDMINTEGLDQVVGMNANGGFRDSFQFVDDGSDGDEVSVMLNTQSGPTADVEVRRALQLATDRAELNDALYDSFYELADGPYRSDSTWHSESGWPDPDVEAARELVEAWEADNGPLSIELTTLSSQDYLELAQALAGQWNEAGVDVSINGIGVAAAGATSVSGAWEAFIWTFFFGADPDEHYAFWDPNPENIGGPGEISINQTRYTSPVLDEAMHGGRSTSDPEERAALYGELWQDFAENVPYVWLFHVDWLVVAKKEIRGLDSFTTPEGEPAAGHVWGSVFFTEAWIAQ